MSDHIAHTPLAGPVEYDFGDATPGGWPRLYVSKDEHVAEKLRWVRSLTQICSYCGWEAQAGGGSWVDLQAHIHQCSEHPVGKLEAAINIALAEDHGDAESYAELVPKILARAMTPSETFDEPINPMKHEQTR